MWAASLYTGPSRFFSVQLNKASSIFEPGLNSREVRMRNSHPLVFTDADLVPEQIESGAKIHEDGWNRETVRHKTRKVLQEKKKAHL